MSAEAIETMSVTLGINDVHVGYAPEREVLATRLVEAGFTPKDIEDLAKTIKSGDKGAILVKELKDHQKARRRIDDYRKVAAAKSERTADKPPAGQGHGQVRRAGGAWEQRKAYALVVVDRKPELFVANELQISVERLRELVKQERALREADMPQQRKKVEDDDAAREKRLQEFRERWGRNP